MSNTEYDYDNELDVRVTYTFMTTRTAQIGIDPNEVRAFHSLPKDAEMTEQLVEAFLEANEEVYADIDISDGEEEPSLISVTL